MEKTANYQLNQWEPTDKISRADFNADNAAIDAAIQAVADTAAGKAGVEELAAVNQSVSALSAALGSGGQNCRITIGSYTGTGTYGSTNPNTLTFPFQPLAVFLTKERGDSFLTILLSGTTQAIYGNAGCEVSWSGNSVEWYNSYNDAAKQFNASDTKYLYVGIGH